MTIEHIRLMCPDCKTVVSHPDGEESIECPRCERFVMRMFWIKLPDNSRLTTSEIAPSTEETKTI